MLLFLIFTIQIKNTGIIFIFIYQNIYFNQILKKSLIKQIDDFLKILKKYLKKKNWLIYLDKYWI